MKKLKLKLETVGNDLNCWRLVWEELKSAAKPDSKKDWWTSTNTAEAMAEKRLRSRTCKKEADAVWNGWK